LVFALIVRAPEASGSVSTELSVVTEFGERVAKALIWRLHHKVIDRRFDERHRVDTGALALGSADPWEAGDYVPTPSRVFRRLMRTLPLEYSAYTFVDLGCGKGRMLLLAAEFGFRRVTGVECDSALYETAVRNLTQARACKRLGTRVHVHHGDVAHYPIPDGPCLFYLYNPFGPAALKQVLDNVEAAYRASPRDMVFVYANPKGRRLFAERGFLCEIPFSAWMRFVNWLSFPWPVAIYRTRNP
jgi:predicted RNA methylase